MSDQNVVAIRRVGGQRPARGKLEAGPMGWTRIDGEHAPHAWHGTYLTIRAGIRDKGILPGGPTSARNMAVYSGNRPAKVGRPNPDVKCPAYKYDAERYACVDALAAQQSGVMFYIADQGAAMTKQTVPPECMKYWYACQPRALVEPAASRRYDMAR